MEKAREFQKNSYFCFIDYAKAFDCVDHNKLWKILKEMGIPDHLILLISEPASKSETGVQQKGLMNKSADQISRSVVSDSLRPHESQHCQASLSITNSQSSLRLMSIKSVMPSSHLILCRPLLLLPPIPPSIFSCVRPQRRQPTRLPGP